MEQDTSDDVDDAFNSKRIPDFDTKFVNDVEVSMDEGNHMFQTPGDCVLDITEPVTNSSISRREQQGQNTCVIEDNDSSAFKESSEGQVTYLHSQMLPRLCGSFINLGLEDRNISLFSSLDSDNVGINYKTNTNYAMKSSSSEYCGAESVSPKMQDIYSSWGADYESCLPYIQTCFNANNDTVKQAPQNKSPDKNPQTDSLSSHLPGRIRTTFAEEGEAGGCGDVHETERDNTRSFALELSAEGLSHNPAATYAQPVTASAAVAIPATSGIIASRKDVFVSEPGSQMDWVSYYLSTVKSAQQGCFEGEARLFSQEPFNSNTLMGRDSLCNNVSKSCVHVKGDTDSDSVPNGSACHSKNPHADINESAKKPVISKTPSQRPAVLGSSSSNDNRKPDTLNLYANAPVVSRKSAQCSRSGSCTTRSNIAILNEASKIEQCKGDSSTVLKQSMLQSPECISPKAYSKFRIYSASNLSNDNRGSGVGKESNFQQSPYHAPVSHVVDTKPNRPMSMAQRLAGHKGGAKTEFSETAKLLDSGSPTCQPHQVSLSGPSNVCDKVQQDAGCEAVLHASYLPDTEFPGLTNPKAVSDRGNMNRSKDHSSGDHSWQSNASDRGFSNSTYCRNDQSKDIQSQEQDIHRSGHQCISQHPSNDRQNVPYQCNQSIFAQNVSPCVSEGSSCNCYKEPFSMQNDFVKNPSIRLSPGEDNHLDIESQVVDKLQDHQHKLNIEPGDLVIDQTEASTDLLTSATQSFGASASLFMGTNRHSDMSDILENFPSFSSKLFEEKATYATCRSSTAGEVRYLSDCLEKERFRRKHCEEHILKQEAKLLEVQQQLAVAVSTGRRKDVMVEQLDKQLAKFVEGWKKKEAEKDEHIRVLKQEKQQIEETLQNQQTMISRFEQELSQCVEELSKEKSNSAQAIESLNNEICQARRDINLAEQTLRQEQQKHAAVMDELNHLKECQELTESRALDAEDQLMKEQNRALQKEQELLNKINAITEANQKMVDLQLLNLEEENKRLQETAIENEELKNELQKSVQAVEQLVKEKETQKAEAADLEMKFKDAQQKFEKDICAVMEKKIADQASESFSQMERSVEELAACHASQVEELNAKHQHDLEQQAQVLNTELLRVERHYQQQLQELEERLLVLTTENTFLKQSQVRVESQRMEVLNKLQAMMQLQWNEAVSLLADTPEKKRSTSPLPSDQDSDHLALDTITPSTSLSTVLSMPQPLLCQVNDDNSPRDVCSCRYAPSGSPATLEVRENMYRTPGVEESLKNARYDDYRTSSVNGNDLRVSENCQVSHRSSPIFHTSEGGSLQSCCSESPTSHNQSDLNNGEEYLTSPKKMNTLPSSGGTHKEQVKHRYHTSMKSPQKPTLLCRSDSSHSSVKSWSELPPVSRKSHILNDNHSGEGLVTPLHLTGLRPNYSPRRSQPQPTLCPSFVSKAARSPAGGGDDYSDMNHVDRSAAHISLDIGNAGCCTDSCSSFCNHHWTAHSDAAVQHCLSVPEIDTEQINQDTAHRQLYTDVPSTNQHQAGTKHQTARYDGGINEASPSATRHTLGQCHVNMNDTSSGCCGSISHQVNQSPCYDQIEEQEQRQGELQHYIRMLLQDDCSSVSSDSNKSVHMSEAGICESVEDLTGNLREHVSEVELLPWQSQVEDTSVNQLSRAAPQGNSQIQFAPDTNLSNRNCCDYRSVVADGRGINLAQGRLQMSPVVSACSLVQSSMKDVSRAWGKKSFSKPHATRKSSDVSRVRNNKVGSQSADTVLNASDKHMGTRRLPKRKSFIH